MSQGKIGLLLCVAACAGIASDWPRFRGPNGTGVSDDKGVPVKWEGDRAVAWKVAIPGVGNSSPVIRGQQLFLQTSSEDGHERRLLCLSAVDGKTLWSTAVPGDRARKHPKNSLASSTPAVDAERVYVLFWDGKAVAVHAYDLKGNLAWRQALGDFTSQHGPGTSPIVVGDRVVVANDQDGASTLYGLEAKTGKVAWKVARPPFRTCYSTPFVLENGGPTPELIVASTAGVTSYNPQTGAENWNWTWAFTGMALRTVASPIFTQGLIFINSGDGSGARHTVAVRAGGHGDVTKTNLVWENKKQNFPYVPSFLARGDHLYYVNDKGMAGCYVAKTGEPVWGERLGEPISASPILVDGKVYAVGEAGTVYVFAAEPTFKLLAKNAVGEPVMATPAVADGRLYIRGKAHLYCIGGGAK